MRNHITKYPQKIYDIVYTWYCIRNKSIKDKDIDKLPKSIVLGIYLEMQDIDNYIIEDVMNIIGYE